MGQTYRYNLDADFDGNGRRRIRKMKNRSRGHRQARRDTRMIENDGQSQDQMTAVMGHPNEYRDEWEK